MASTQPLSLGFDHPPLTLLADGDADTRRMYADFLILSAGCEIEEAEDGREALAKAISRRPDVIVTETRLPGLSGFDLCALLRRDTLTSTTPVIFVTFEVDLRRAVRAGADAVLTKPCLPDHLFSEIRNVLTRAADLRARGDAAREHMTRPLERSNALPEQSQASGVKSRRVMLSHTHLRRDTIDPPTPPPALVCPNCDLLLRYLRSHIGGVSARHPEQWDYFECAAGCGAFQFRERTRTIRKV